jgi:hypothetical protein
MNWRQVPTDRLLERPVLASDFFNALQQVKSSVSQDSVQQNREWTEEFGSEGA